MSRVWWGSVGILCGVLSTVVAAYFYLRSQALTHGWSAKCLHCGAKYHYAHPALQKEALGYHQVRCPGLEP